MVLIAFILGVWWGWLVELVKPVCRYVVIASRALAVFLFVLVAFVFFHAVYTRQVGDWSSWSLRLINFITAPAQIWPIIGFLVGWFGYARRDALAQLIGSLAQSPPEQRAREHRGQPGKPTSESSSPANNAPDKPAAQGLLAKIVGLPLLGVAVIIIVLIVFGPELQSRLELLKFGEVEARFVAAAQKSLQTFAMYTGRFTPTIPIAESGSANKSELEFNGLIQEEIMKRMGMSDEDRTTIRVEHQRVMEFHADIVFPFADAMTCYLTTFSQQDIDLRRKAINLALQWRELSVKATVAHSEAPSGEFSALVAATFALAQEYAKAASGSPMCRVPALREAPTGNQFRNHLPALFANGFVIGFVANLVATTHDHEEAVEFFNKMASVLDNRPVQRLAQMRFYGGRATAKEYARWYPRDAGSDLRHARRIADGMIGIVAGSADADGRLALYLGKERGGILNSEIFLMVRDWGEGYRLSRDEIAALEESAAELHKWAGRYSPKALGEDPDEVIVAPLVHLIAVVHDTLAMAEIAVGESKSDRSKDRCARILEHLAKSKDLFQWWSQVRARRSLSQAANYRSNFRTIDAHYQLYGSFCNV